MGIWLQRPKRQEKNKKGFKTKVEAEKAHAAPIQRADDDQHQRDLINDFQNMTSLK